jgi:hypothetical protein
MSSKLQVFGILFSPKISKESWCPLHRLLLFIHLCIVDSKYIGIDVHTVVAILNSKTHSFRLHMLKKFNEDCNAHRSWMR